MFQQSPNKISLFFVKEQHGITINLISKLIFTLTEFLHNLAKLSLNILMQYKVVGLGRKIHTKFQVTYFYNGPYLFEHMLPMKGRFILWS